MGGRGGRQTRGQGACSGLLPAMLREPGSAGEPTTCKALTHYALPSSCRLLGYSGLAPDSGITPGGILGPYGVLGRKYRQPRVEVPTCCTGHTVLRVLYCARSSLMPTDGALSRVSGHRPRNKVERGVRGALGSVVWTNIGAVAVQSRETEQD